MSVSTRERILDAAMELFAERGYRGTSIVLIERAAGLSPGSGSLYNHFPTKQAVLRAGLQRQLGRSSALGDIRRLLLDLGDLRAELTVLGRYTLTVLDSEADLLRLVLTEARHQPEALGPVVDQLLDSTYIGFAQWLSDRTELPPEQAKTVATLGLGALLSTRLVALLLGRPPAQIEDTDLVRTWVDMMQSQIKAPRDPRAHG